jgi:hypothetical protein
MDGEEKFAKFLTRNHVVSFMRRDPHSTEEQTKSNCPCQIDSYFYH